jgi:hypothetical protein
MFVPARKGSGGSKILCAGSLHAPAHQPITREGLSSGADSGPALDATRKYLSYDPQCVDVVGDPIDLAVRIGTPREAGLLIKRERGMCSTTAKRCSEGPRVLRLSRGTIPRHAPGKGRQADALDALQPNSGQCADAVRLAGICGASMGTEERPNAQATRWADAATRGSVPIPSPIAPQNSMAIV